MSVRAGKAYIEGLQMTNDEPNWTAEMDQAMAGLGDMAKILGSYYTDLIREHVPPELSASLIVDYQGYMLEQQGED